MISDKGNSESEKALIHLPSKSSPSRWSEVSVESKPKRICILNISTCPGCKTIYEPPDENQRIQHEILFWRTMADIAGIRDGPLHLLQLQQAFINSYFSMGVINSNQQYFNIFYWLSPQSPAMQASRDALCLVHLGSRHRDQRLVIEGRTRHLSAIRYLRRDVDKPESLTDDAVLGAAYTLGQTEIFMAVSHVGEGYLGHMDGILHIFQRRGPKSFTSPFARALLHNTRPVAVAVGLLRRPPMFFSSPSWIAAANQTPTLAVALTNLALRIPILLQKADNLLDSKSPAQANIMSVLTGLVQLERQIQDWLLMFYKMESGNMVPYRLANVSKYPSFQSRCGGLAKVFPSVIEFPSFVSSTSHVYVWICLLVLRQTIIDVAALHTYPIVRPQKQEASLTASANECAINLCQSIAFLTRLEHASCGIVACSGPLHFAIAWFERQQNVQRLVWARHVREFLQRDILLGGSYDTSLNIQRPLFVWWMLPDIVIDGKNK